MKKIISLLVLIAATAASVASDFRAESFLNPGTFGPYLVTNAACSVCYTTALFGGIKITNAAAAPLGGFTNILSPTAGANGTNSNLLQWTNHNGIWVIVTNATPGSVTGILFVTNDATPLVQDVPLPISASGQIMGLVVATNTTPGWSDMMISPYNLSIRFNGDASAATGMNLIFAGVPDGLNEVTGANGAPNVFQWGVTPASGQTTVTTNFPMWRFVGSKAIRLRSATLTTTTAANIGVTIQSLTLNGPVP